MRENNRLYSELSGYLHRTFFVQLYIVYNAVQFLFLTQNRQICCLESVVNTIRDHTMFYNLQSTFFESL